MKAKKSRGEKRKKVHKKSNHCVSLSLSLSIYLSPVSLAQKILPGLAPMSRKVRKRERETEREGRERERREKERGERGERERGERRGF